MERYEFDNRNGAGGNDNLKNGLTRHGAIEIYPDFAGLGCLSLDIRGPVKAFRGSALLDRETAERVGKALLQWAKRPRRFSRRRTGLPPQAKKHFPHLQT